MISDFQDQSISYQNQQSPINKLKQKKFLSKSAAKRPYSAIKSQGPSPMSIQRTKLKEMQKTHAQIKLVDESMLNKSKNDMIQKLAHLQNNDDSEKKLFKTKFVRMYAKLKASQLTQDHNMYFNDSAKLKEEPQRIVNALETRIKKIMNKSQSKDMVGKMIEAIDNVKQFKKIRLSTLNFPNSNSKKRISDKQQVNMLVNDLIDTGSAKFREDIILHSYQSETEDSDQNTSRKPFTFSHNLDVDKFFAMPYEKRLQYKVQPNLLSFLQPVKGRLIDAAFQIKRGQKESFARSYLSSGALMDFGDQPSKIVGFWIKKETKGYQPVSRDGPCLKYDNENKSIIICGGHSSQSIFDIHKVPIKKGAHWIRQTPQINIFSFFGANIKIFKTHNSPDFKVLIFGGVAILEKSQGTNKSKFCSSDIKILNLSTLQWDDRKIKNDSVIGRKHAASTLVSNFFYVQGGQETKGECLCDMHAFNLDTLDWKKLDVKRNNKINVEHYDLYRSNHTIDAYETSSFVYFVIFGGLDKLNIATNNLYLLTLKKDDSTVFIKELRDVRGRAPIARSHHSSLLIKDNQYLIIYGGKNEAMFRGPSSNGVLCESSTRLTNHLSEISLNDMVIFNFKLNQWELIEMIGFRPDSRWNACIDYDADENRIFLFGGSNLKGYCRNDLFVCEMRLERIELLSLRVRNAQQSINNMEKGLYNNNLVPYRGGTSKQVTFSKSNETSYDGKQKIIIKNSGNSKGSRGSTPLEVIEQIDS